MIRSAQMAIGIAIRAWRVNERAACCLWQTVGYELDWPPRDSMRLRLRKEEDGRRDRGQAVDCCGYILGDGFLRGQKAKAPIAFRHTTTGMLTSVLVPNDRSSSWSGKYFASASLPDATRNLLRSST
ncbi:hypothetical protein ACTMU2_41555 [Cupriavidus basilensis]